MNLKEEKYKRFALAREMLETADVVRKLDVEKITSFPVLRDKVLFSGEGSSRIFPAKNLLYSAMSEGFDGAFYTENGSQAREYELSGFSLFIASNSGKTAEAVRLIRQARDTGTADITGIAAHPDTPVLNESDRSYLLTCGGEDAVAATKSVVEQALFYDILFRSKNNAVMPDLKKLGDAIELVLELRIPKGMVATLAGSPVIYFAGRNNGVAEELTLKTNEITRKKSDFLEGTYAVHGIEEVMAPEETVVVIDPFPDEEEKFMDVLAKGVGMKVFAVASRETRFSTLVLPELGEFNTYLQLAAGWNMLVETGLELGINLDKPERARKVGNEYAGS